METNSALDCQVENDIFDGEDSFNSFMEKDPLFESNLDTVANQDYCFCNAMEAEFCFFGDLCPLIPNQKTLILSGNNGDAINLNDHEKLERLKNNTSIANGLTKQVISCYFYMPIAQAAKQLKVGLTLLKKRCRELGIQRWPYRKLSSLQTLLNNIYKEMGSCRVEEGENGRRLRGEIEALEVEKKIVEEMPNLQLETKIKRLRQSYFKANFKKRRLNKSAS